MSYVITRVAQEVARKPITWVLLLAVAVTLLSAKLYTELLTQRSVLAAHVAEVKGEMSLRVAEAKAQRDATEYVLLQKVHELQTKVASQEAIAEANRLEQTQAALRAAEEEAYANRSYWSRFKGMFSSDGDDTGVVAAIAAPAEEEVEEEVEETPGYWGRLYWASPRTWIGLEQ